MQRAQNGVSRLRSILTNLTEAANLEEAMRGETKELINLPMLISEFVDGYRTSFPSHQFLLESHTHDLFIEGSPDHLAQMLDKLIDNAVQFSLPDKAILVRIRNIETEVRVSVLNEGQELSETISDKMFDPMVSYGKTNAKYSHLGLGLFVVRLIVEYHQGKTWANNRTDTKGVEVTISLPLSENHHAT